MKFTLAQLLILTAVLCGVLPVVGAEGQTPPPEQTQVAKPSAAPWKLLFSGAQDITDTWGLLHFGVTPVRRIRECEPPGFTLIGGFPLPDGAWEVFGQQLTEIRRGEERSRQVSGQFAANGLVDQARS